LQISLNEEVNEEEKKKKRKKEPQGSSHGPPLRDPTVMPRGELPG
jgi:hypothetical protein